MIKKKNQETIKIILEKKRVWVIDQEYVPAVTEEVWVIDKEYKPSWEEKIPKYEWKETWWVYIDESDEKEIYYSKEEAYNRYLEVPLSSWGSGEMEEVYVGDEIIIHPEEKEEGHYETIVIKEEIKEKGHYEYIEN